MHGTVILCVVSCVIYSRVNAASLFTTPDLNQTIYDVWEEYPTLHETGVHVAVYNSQEQKFRYYTTDGKSIKSVEGPPDPTDPEAVYWDVQRREFRPIQEITPTVVVENDNVLAVTVGLETIRTRLGNLTYNTSTGQVGSSNTCTPGTDSAVTIREYKRMHHMGHTGPDVVHPRLFWRCTDDGQQQLNHCGAHEQWSPEHGCRAVIKPQRRLYIESSTRLLTDTDRGFYVREGDNYVFIACPGGVDATGTRCKDVRCSNDTGMNLMPLPFETTKGLRATAYQGVYECVDGVVTVETTCRCERVEHVVTIDRTPFTFLYPRELYDVAKGHCRPVVGSDIEPLRVLTDVKAYAALKDTLYVRLFGVNKTERVFQRVTAAQLPMSRTVAMLNNCRAFVQNNGAGLQSEKTSQPAIVYKNVIYETVMSDLLERVHAAFPTKTPYTIEARFVKTTRFWFNIIGNTVLDVLEFLDEGEEGAMNTTALVDEVKLALPDDFFHLPAYIYSVFEPGQTRRPMRYHSTVSLYKLPSYLDEGMDSKAYDDERALYFKSYFDRLTRQLAEMNMTPPPSP